MKIHAENTIRYKAADSSQEFPNTNQAMSAKAIDWELIKQHLDRAVKHAVDIV